MMVPPRPDRDALSLDELKTLVVELLVRVSAQEEEIRQLRAEKIEQPVVWNFSDGVITHPGIPI
jgi:hypothetical protein